jgi:anion-transporting  ArsA/GET3 family ATPase
MGSLFEKRLILVLGKWGVGRSTVSAALAAATARHGRRTLLYEANAKDRYASFFNGPAVGSQPTELRRNLFAVNTNPTEALHEYGLMVLRFERVYKLVFENRLTRYFLRAIPGLDDYSILGKAWYHTKETRWGRPAWDTLVFDMPASGHALSMLRIPSSILKAVPEGPLTRDARSVRELLMDPERTAVVMVTLAEEMPTNEAREFAEILRDELRTPVTHLVVNQVYPDRFPRGSAEDRVLTALADCADAELAALAAHGQLGRSRRALNEHYLTRLANSIHAPRVELPYLFRPSLGVAQIDDLSLRLEQGLR